MHTRLAFRRIATIFGAVCMLLIVWHLYWRPVILRVAVGPVDSGQWRFVQATAKALKDTGQPFRLRLVPVEQSTSASAALEKGVVDLAVLRSDDPTSTEARSIAVLHKRSIMLVVSQSSEINSIDDLRGKHIGIMIGETDSYRSLVDRIIEHHEIAPEDVVLDEMRSTDLAIALEQGRISGFFLVGHPSGGITRAVLNALAHRRNVQYSVIGIEPAEALAFRYREFEQIDLPKGIFGGRPPRPAEDISTVAITYELTASDRLPEQRASILTKSLLELRTRLRRDQPESTFDFEAPPVDKPRRFLPHAGTAAYVNDDAKSLLETYSDQIWLGLFGLSLLGSSIAGLLGWAGFGPERKAPGGGEMAREMARRLSAATTMADLDTLQADIDDVVLGLLTDSANEGGDRTARMPEWIAMLGPLIERRRALLSGLDVGGVTRARERPAA